MCGENMNTAPISNVNVNSNTTLSKRCNVPAFGNEENAKAPVKTETSADKFLKKTQTMSPAAVGISSAALWFGVGFAIDRLIGMVSKSMKSSLKSSLIMNSVFGAVMGAMAFWRARKEG